MSPLGNESIPLARAFKTQSLPKCLPAGSQVLHIQTVATSMADILQKWPTLLNPLTVVKKNEIEEIEEQNGDHHLGVEKTYRDVTGLSGDV